ncbi:hypothetical protein BC332_16089 [Capsicum chinense]|nr:hypothetical protein BC332_16089 [Capsicum chinense]
MDDLTKPVDEESIKVTTDGFLHALNEVRPAFGASTDDLERCRTSTACGVKRLNTANPGQISNMYML